MKPSTRRAVHPAGSGKGPAPVRFRPRSFRSPTWLRGPHAQTLGGKLLRPRTGPPVERLRLDLPDGDFLDLDLAPDPGPGAPLVLILHGLEGSSRRSYVRSMSGLLLESGMRPVAMNFRGCSGEPNRSPRFYHSGETGDLSFVVDHLLERFPERSLGLVGFSLGGNVLLKYLGERGDDVPERVHAGVGISVPFDLAAGCRTIERGLWGRIYSHYFLDMLRKKVRTRRRQLEPHMDVRAALRARTLWSFDDVATAPLHGFRDAREYYRRSSSLHFLEGIRVPTLLVQARDDPFQPPERLPEKAIAENPRLVPAFSDRGGHVGFVGGRPWAPVFFADEESVRFLLYALGTGPG